MILPDQEVRRRRDSEENKERKIYALVSGRFVEAAGPLQQLRGAMTSASSALVCGFFVGCGAGRTLGLEPALFLSMLPFALAAQSLSSGEYRARVVIGAGPSFF